MASNLQQRKMMLSWDVATTIVDTGCCSDEMCVTRGWQLGRVNPCALWPFNDCFEPGESADALFAFPRSYESHISVCELFCPMMIGGDVR